MVLKFASMECSHFYSSQFLLPQTFMQTWVAKLDDKGNKFLSSESRILKTNENIKNKVKFRKI